PADEAYGNVAGGSVDPLFTGDVAVGLVSGPRRGKLTGVTTASFTDGVATLGKLALTRVGSYSLPAGGSTLTDDTRTLDVVAAPTFKITLTPVTPGNFSAGQNFNVTVTAMLHHKADSGYLGTISLASSDLHAAGLPSTYAFKAVDAGTQSFVVTL